MTNKSSSALAVIFSLILLPSCQQVSGQPDGTDQPVAPAQSVPAPLSAQDTPPVVGSGIQYTTDATRESYQKCIDASEGITPKMQDCIAEEYEYQDRRMNTAYAQLMQRLDGDAEARLRDAQRDWVARRDTECVPGDDPGQAQMLVSDDCSMELTAARAAELEKMLAAATGSG